MNTESPLNIQRLLAKVPKTTTTTAAAAAAAEQEKKKKHKVRSLNQGQVTE